MSEGLRRVAREERFWLPDETAITMIAGHVRANRAETDVTAGWSGNYMTVPGKQIPKGRLAEAIGQPVSELHTHPFLSPDMIVLEADCRDGGEGPYLVVKYTTRRQLFCDASGRVWEMPLREIETASFSRSNVVPFPAQRPAA